MKKIFFSLLVVAFLTGCAETMEDTQETNTSNETATVTQSTPDTATEEEIETPRTEAPADAYNELTNQDYFNPEDYETHLVTDNPGSRVFIFSEGNRPAYKTVYIKPDNRLKVINLTTHELLMNEHI